MNQRRIRLFSGFLVALAAVTPARADDYVVTTIAEDLEYPWSLAFLPDGGMLVTERAGRLDLIPPDGKRIEIDGVPPVYARGQGGLFEVLLHPDFENSGVIFLSYAHGTRQENATRVARARLDGTTLKDLEVIFEVDPLKNTSIHYGGRMVFLPDGTLLVTTGEGGNFRERSQDLEWQFGKTIRINEDGSVPADNPFVGNDAANDKIWTYGHRNPQGLIYDAETDSVYLHEHGPRGGDELNLVEKGKNYGWPVATYGIDYSGATITPYTEYEGMEQPVVYWVPSIAPAGMAMYRGGLFPDWSGDIFVAALAERSIRRLDMESGQVMDQEILFTDMGERFRDVRTGPDGALYLLTDDEDGKVLKVTPAG